MNKYLEKIASIKEVKKQRATGQDFLDGTRASLGGALTGTVLAGVASAPPALIAHGLVMKGLHEGDDVSTATINKFIHEHGLKNVYHNSPYALSGKSTSHSLHGTAHAGPHALPNSSFTKLIRGAAHPDDREFLKKITTNSSGHINMGGAKHGGVALHELGHLVNSENYGLHTARQAVRPLKFAAPMAMLGMKGHEDDAWKAEALMQAPMLADELGTNLRAYNYVKKHQPHALAGSRGALIGSALSYATLAGAETGSMYLGGKFAKKIRQHIDDERSRVSNFKKKYS